MIGIKRRKDVEAAFAEFKDTLEGLGVETANLRIRIAESPQEGLTRYEIHHENEWPDPPFFPFPWRVSSPDPDDFESPHMQVGARPREAVRSLLYATEVLRTVAGIKAGRIHWW